MTTLPIGEAVRRARKAQGLAVQTVASRAGVHRNTLDRLERGIHATTTLEHFVRVADAIGIEAPRLLARAYRLRTKQGEAMSRPRQILLLVDDDETTMSTRRMQLDLWGWRIVSATTAEEAMQLLEATMPVPHEKDRGIELLVCRERGRTLDGMELVRRAKRMRPIIATVLVSHRSGVPGDQPADLFLTRHTPPAEVRDRLRIAGGRKRGPRKAATVAAAYLANETYRRSA